jgi:hypothetical protein
MKIKSFSQIIAAVCSLPLASFAQGTYLSDPASTNNHAVVVSAGGNVGIGTLNPIDMLSVGNGESLSLNADTSSQTTRLRWRYQGEEVTWIERLHDIGAMVFGNQWVERLRITLDGNIGVGTPTPRSLLEVAGIITSRTTSSGGQASLELDSAFPDAPRASRIDFQQRGTTRWTLINDYEQVGANDFRLVQDGSTTPLSVLTVVRGGNVGIGTTSPQAKLDVAGKVNCTVLELTSDRAKKSGFAPVDCGAMLAQVARLPLSTWYYTNETSVTHIGPMAQDFQAAFHVGSDDKHIATVDADGILFAAVQALNQKLEAELQSKAARIASLEKEVASLRTDLASRLSQLEKQFAHSSPAPAETSPGLPAVESAAER